MIKDEVIKTPKTLEVVNFKNSNLIRTIYQLDANRDKVFKERILNLSFENQKKLVEEVLQIGDKLYSSSIYPYINSSPPDITPYQAQFKDKTGADSQDINKYNEETIYNMFDIINDENDIDKINSYYDKLSIFLAENNI